MHPDKLDTWLHWIGGKNSHGAISKELSDLAIIREVHSGVAAMVRANPTLQRHSAFHSVFSLNYTHSVLMYVRRQVQPQPERASLIVLAQDLLDHAEMVTQDYYVSLWTASARDERDRAHREREAQASFAEHFGGSVVHHLDPAIMERDLDDLTSIADSSSRYLDRRITHLDKREPDRMPTRRELENWCDVLNSKLRRYTLLLQATDYRIEPVLTHDWRAIFKEAWLPDTRSA